MAKDLSTLEWKEVQEWLMNNNMDKYVSHFQPFFVNGYDLCYLANEDFAEMSINNFHDKNIILRNIRMMTLEELKLTMQYEGKRVTVQLDFEPSFTAEMLAMSLCDLFHIQNKIYLSTSDGEILMPNIKIVELILLNPKKYKHLKILTEKDAFSSASSNHISGTVGNNSAYTPTNNSGATYKGYEDTSKIHAPSTNDHEYRQKSLKDTYPSYEPSRKFEKNDIEKEYLLYKESKANNNIPPSGSTNNSNIEPVMTKDQMITQSKLEQYKGFKDNNNKEHRPFTPIEKQRFNMSIKDKDPIPSSYQSKNYDQNDSASKQAMDNNNDSGYMFNSNNDYYDGYNKSTKSNLNDNFRLPLPLDDIKKDNSSYKNYSNNNMNNPTTFQQQQTRYKEDPKKFSSEKRSFRSSDPNANDNELLTKQPSEDKYSNFNERQVINEEPQYMKKQGKENVSNQMDNSTSQNMYDLKNKGRPDPMARGNYDYDSSQSLGVKGKQGSSVNRSSFNKV